jgi:hypothetical protein
MKSISIINRPILMSSDRSYNLPNDVPEINGNIINQTVLGQLFPMKEGISTYQFR